MGGQILGYNNSRGVNAIKDDVFVTSIEELVTHLLTVKWNLLKEELITLRDPSQNPNTSSPCYNPNVKCAYHSNSTGHDTNKCWVLKTKI